MLAQASLIVAVGFLASWFVARLRTWLWPNLAASEKKERMTLFALTMILIIASLLGYIDLNARSAPPPNLRAGAEFFLSIAILIP